MDPDPFLLLSSVPNTNLIGFQLIFNILLIAIVILGLVALFMLTMFEKALIKLETDELKSIEKKHADYFDRLRNLFAENENMSTTFAVARLLIVIFTIVSTFFLLPYSHQYSLILGLMIVVVLGVVNWVFPLIMPADSTIWTLRGLKYTNAVLNKITPLANRIAPAEPKLPEEDVSLEELKTALPEKDHKSPSIANLNLYKQVLRFDKILIKNVMRPKKEIAGIKANYNFKEVLTKIELSSFSRLPVYEENWQHILGIIHCKDLLPYTHLETYDWKQHLRPIVYVQENDFARSVLRIFQNSKSHMALVQNEAMQLVGIVTLEDITEEIIGEIDDE